MNLALTEGMRIFNDAITIHRIKQIKVRHEVPEHSEACETMHIPTEYDYTAWNKELKAWQCQYCQRVFDADTSKYITEDERKEQLKYES